MSNGRAMGRQNVNALNRAGPETNVCLIPYKYTRDATARDRGPFILNYRRGGKSERIAADERGKTAGKTETWRSNDSVVGALVPSAHNLYNLQSGFFFFNTPNVIFRVSCRLFKTKRKENQLAEGPGRAMQRFIQQKD